MAKLEDIGKSLEALARKQLLIGVPESETARKPPADPRITNAAIGYIHERGGHGIPARPHLVEGVKDAMDTINAEFQLAAEAAIRGDSEENIDRHLGKAGQAAQESVQKKIRQKLSPEIEPESLLKRVTGARLHPFPGSQDRRIGTLRKQYEDQIKKAFPELRGKPVERAQAARRAGMTLIELARSQVSETRPLWDTDSYLNSIRWVIREK